MMISMWWLFVFLMLTAIPIILLLDKAPGWFIGFVYGCIIGGWIVVAVLREKESV